MTAHWNIIIRQNRDKWITVTLTGLLGWDDADWRLRLCVPGADESFYESTDWEMVDADPNVRILRITAAESALFPAGNFVFQFDLIDVVRGVFTPDVYNPRGQVQKGLGPFVATAINCCGIDTLAITGNSVLDAAYLAAMQASDVNSIIGVMAYDDTATSVGNHPVRTNRDTPESNIDIPYLCQWIAEQRVVRGNPTPFYVMLDFEGDFYDWIDSGVPANVLKAQQRMAAAIEGVHAQFGSDVKIGYWGGPRIVLSDYKSSNPAQKLVLEQESADRWGPVLGICDFLMPSHYSVWPDTATMTPAVWDYPVVATGVDAPDTPAEFEPFWEAANDWRNGEVRACLLIMDEYEMDCPLWPSMFLYWATPSVAFRSGTETPQWLPEAQVVRELASAKAVDPRVTGFNIWYPASYFLNYWVFTIDIDRSRTSVTATYYDSVSPVPGTFPAWNDAGLELDVRVKYNDRLLAIMRAVNRAIQ